MGNVRFISITTARPSTDDEVAQRIELTPWDLRTLPNTCIQKGLLFHKPTDLSPNWIQHLEATLSRALALFYPLAGRLAVEDNEDGTSSFFLRCNNEGVQFVHAVADDISVDDILKPVNVPDDIIYSLFLNNGVSNYQGTSNPLLALQVTELIDGIFVAYTSNHSVLDGTSMWHFLNTWSEICRGGGGDPISQPPPDFGRGFLKGIVDLPIRIPSFLDKLPEEFVPPPLRQRIFHFSRESIAKLKLKANSHMGTAANKISSLQALLGHLWVCITRNRGYLKPEEEVSIGIAMSMRQRMDPPVPEKYFGSSVITRRIASTAGEIVEKGSGWAAWQICRSIESFTAVEMRKFAEDWARNPVMTKLVTRSGNSLFVGSSPRFDVYGNDFGWGRPVAVRSGPSNKFDGKLTVFAGAEEGSVDFEACLMPEALEALVEDVEFMETVSISKLWF